MEPRQKRVLGFFLLVLLAPILFSTSSGALRGEAADRPTIALIVMAVDSEYWLTVGAGAQAACKELGASLIFKGPSYSTDIAGQVSLVEDMVSRKVDAILLAPSDADALVPAINRAVALGIPVILVDSAANTNSAVSYVATDNEKGGEAAAQALAEAIGRKGKVALVNFVPGQTTAMARARGFEQGLKRFPDIKLVAVQYSQSDRAIGMKVTEDILTAHPDIAGIFGANSRSALGAGQAIKNRNLVGKVKLVGFDAVPDEISMLEDGVISALIAQHPYSIGYEGVRIALAHLRGEVVPKRVDTGISVITKGNMREPDIQKVLYPEKLGKPN